MKFNSYAEYLSHPVFRTIRRLAMQTTSGHCKYCGADATEVHHFKGYPPWGAFDVPSNLQPVCHACHCNLENKPS